MDYLINNNSWYKEGGYCGLYPILGKRKIAFKEFWNKERAKYAWSVQKKLYKYGLAPKVYTDVCKLKFAKDIEHWVPENSEWGYVTELAKVSDSKKIITYKKIQDLVESIYYHTGLKFWDCHYSNIGLIKQKLVCIDTGKESFDGRANAWSNVDPGPKCGYCLKFICKCEE